MRGGEAIMTARVMPAPLPPRSPPTTAPQVSGAPDPRFNGRDVFMMAIQMPNLTSYSGSWLMWYTDHMRRETGLAAIAAPVPHRKVDPKYIATAAEERVEGNVTLGCVIDTEGKVAGVELIRGIDDRLNESAQEALSKWEFYPASRNGIPVAVDVLVEIPFRLAPKLPRR
jgi:TonB family protein